MCAFKRCISALIFIVLILISNSAYANQEKLKIGYLHFPPFYQINKNEPPKGIYIDILKKIFKNSGLDYEIKGLPPKRLYSDLANGKINVWMGTKGVKIYENKVFVVEDKIADIFMRIFWIDGTRPINNISDLKGEKIITILGYNYGGFIKYLNDKKNNIQTDPSPNHLTAFKKLKAKRAKYVLDYKFPSEETLKKVNIKNLKWKDLKQIGIYINISKSTKNVDDVFKKITKSVEYLKSKNEI